jgi:hypothetical protein
MYEAERMGSQIHGYPAQFLLSAQYEISAFTSDFSIAEALSIVFFNRVDPNFQFDSRV